MVEGITEQHLKTLIKASSNYLMFTHNATMVEDILSTIEDLAPNLDQDTILDMGLLKTPAFSIGRLERLKSVVIQELEARGKA